MHFSLNCKLVRVSRIRSTHPITQRYTRDTRVGYTIRGDGRLQGMIQRTDVTENNGYCFVRVPCFILRALKVKGEMVYYLQLIRYDVFVA